MADSIDELSGLRRLNSAGALGDEEFETRRRAIMAGRLSKAGHAIETNEPQDGSWTQSPTDSPDISPIAESNASKSDPASASLETEIEVGTSTRTHQAPTNKPDTIIESSQPPMADWIDQISELRRLKNEGALSDEEFEAHRRAIMAKRSSAATSEVEQTAQEGQAGSGMQMHDAPPTTSGGSPAIKASADLRPSEVPASATTNSHQPEPDAANPSDTLPKARRGTLRFDLRLILLTSTLILALIAAGFAYRAFQQPTKILAWSPGAAVQTGGASTLPPKKSAAQVAPTARQGATNAPTVTPPSSMAISPKHELIGSSISSNRILSNGNAIIKGSWTFDLEAGRLTQEQYDADLWWELENETKRSLEPKNKAAFHLIGKTDFSSLKPGKIRKFYYTSDAIIANNDFSNKIPSGTVLAYKTRHGNYGKLLIEKYGRDLSISWVTYDFDAPLNAEKSKYAESISPNTKPDADHATLTSPHERNWYEQNPSSRLSPIYIKEVQQGSLLIWNISGTYPAGAQSPATWGNFFVRAQGQAVGTPPVFLHRFTLDAQPGGWYSVQIVFPHIFADSANQHYIGFCIGPIGTCWPSGNLLQGRPD